MKLHTTTVTGCGSGSCLCAGTAVSRVPPAINGVVLHHPDQRPDNNVLQARARGELLRQHAVSLGLLPPHAGLIAPELNDQDRGVIQSMIDQAVPPAQLDEEACAHHFETHKHLFVHGQALHVRHILFAVTHSVNVHALLVQAEQALLELSRPGVQADRFARLAAELSDCPTGSVGGDLGWLCPEVCDPELAGELFDHKHSRWGMGVHPRLIHTRHGFHILEVLGRRKGRPPIYQEVRERVAANLAMCQRAAAFQQYIAGLAEAAKVVGIELEGVAREGGIKSLFQ